MDFPVDHLSNAPRVVSLLTEVGPEENIYCLRPKATGPRRSLVPNSVTMRRTIAVARLISSSPEPVLTSPKTTVSAEGGNHRDAEVLAGQI